MSWKRDPERDVPFEPGEDKKYRHQIDALRAGKKPPRNASCAYEPWPRLVGRGKSSVDTQNRPLMDT